MVSLVGSLKFVCYAYCFYPDKLRKAAAEAKEEFGRSQKKRLQNVVKALTEEEQSLLETYWRYDEALIDGGYTFERLKVCHGADVVLANGKTLEKYTETYEDEEGDNIIRSLYQEDVNHVIKGGVLFDLGREYCLPTDGEKDTEQKRKNLKTRTEIRRMVRNTQEAGFGEYIKCMTGMDYHKLWPDARWLLSESWKWDKYLLEDNSGSECNYLCSCYSYERLKVCRSFEVNKWGNKYRGMFPIYSNEDKIEEIKKAMTNGYKRESGDGKVFHNYLHDLDVSRQPRRTKRKRYH